ncbi:hypothetical protein Vadar_012099 [Vaccinium darrowii]|uniref:Uncharacterized protein n=1 Tax=Vaccinium darrowii TaxID=229202 RepID=A0ACB7ZB51_9ERIC|nr:hypothetical protein Vadar_012099 [Vaccinium darrowii]
MESDVVRRLRSFTLTADEEEDILLEPEVHQRALERCSFSLVGKVLTHKSVNSVALKDTMKKVWGVKDEVSIIDVESNLFLFRFSSEVHMHRVIAEGPWSFDNQLRIGEVLDVDEKSINEDRGKFVRVRVRICIDKPLKRGGNLVDREGNKVWINYKYERLPIFCYFCGLLGHEERSCHSRWETDHDDVGAETYGPWMQATMGRGKRFGRRGVSSDENVPSNGRFSDVGESALRSGTVAERDLAPSRRELAVVQSGCSGDVDPVQGEGEVEGTDDVLVTSNEMTCQGRELVQAPRKVCSNLNEACKAGVMTSLNLKGMLTEGKDIDGNGANLFGLGGPGERAQEFKSEDSFVKGQSNMQTNMLMGPKEFLAAQGRVELNEAQLLDVSVQSLGLDGLLSSGGGIAFRAQSNNTPSNSKRGRGRGKGKGGLGQERRARASGGSSGGGLLGKRRSSSDGEAFGARYDVGASKRSVLKNDGVVLGVEVASPEWPHQAP